MASISITYNSATSYTVAVSGMTVGQKYHVFTEDINTSGGVTGYVCRYTQTASSSSWSNSYTCGSAYSGFTRHAYLYCTGTTATSHSVGSTYSASQLPSSSGGMWSAYDSWSGGGTTTSYKITLKVGSGVERISYKINSSSSETTYMLNASTGSVTRDVGSGGYLYVTAITYEDGYTYPVIATDQTLTPYSSFTMINSSGGWSDHYISAPSGGGTRTVNISATYAPTYYYRIKAYANGGTFPSGTETYNSAIYSTTDSYVTYNLGNISTPTRSGYTFKGWGSSASATTVYGSTVSFTASSTSDNYPTVKEVYAVWQLTSVTITLDGNGGKWDAATGRLTITKNVGDMLSFATYSSLTRAGYTLLGWSASKSATTATYGTNGYVTVGATDATYYAVWQKNVIALFYWSSASADATLIAKGKPVKNLTSVRWNSLMAKIKEVAEAEGGTFSYGSVSSGGTFYATEFNEARTGILNLTGYGTLPAAQSAGGQVKAALFEGSGSLKTALNAAIDHYNNS